MSLLRSKLADEAASSLSYKIALAGDSGVGKTQIINRYLHDKFNDDLISTIGVDLQSSLVKIENCEDVVKLNIWDTAGQERYRSLTSAFFRDADGILIIFSIDDEESFSSVTKWLHQIKMTHIGNPVIFLIGNKSDLESKRVIHQDQINELQSNEKLNIRSYIETSAKERGNIVTLFRRMASIIYNEKHPKKKEDNIILSNSRSKSDSNQNCC